MAKILTDIEMAEIVHKAVHDRGLVDCADTYRHFLAALGDLIAEHFGSERGNVGDPSSDIGWTCGFHVNDCVPSDGGVFKDYDTDVVWKDGKELDAVTREERLQSALNSAETLLRTERETVCDDTLAAEYDRVLTQISEVDDG